MSDAMSDAIAGGEQHERPVNEFGIRMQFARFGRTGIVLAAVLVLIIAIVIEMLPVFIVTSKVDSVADEIADIKLMLMLFLANRSHS